MIEKRYRSTNFVVEIFTQLFHKDWDSKGNVCGFLRRKHFECNFLFNPVSLDEDNFFFVCLILYEATSGLTLGVTTQFYTDYVGYMGLIFCIRQLMIHDSIKKKLHFCLCASTRSCTVATADNKVSLNLKTGTFMGETKCQR